MMTTADPFVQFASKVGWGVRKLEGKLSTAEVASFKSGKKIALTMMVWVTHGDKVSAGWRL